MVCGAVCNVVCSCEGACRLWASGGAGQGRAVLEHEQAYVTCSSASEQGTYTYDGRGAGLGAVQDAEVRSTAKHRKSRSTAGQAGMMR
jgi:hypothetical protein